MLEIYLLFNLSIKRLRVCDIYNENTKEYYIW